MDGGLYGGNEIKNPGAEITTRKEDFLSRTQSWKGGLSRNDKLS